MVKALALPLLCLALLVAAAPAAAAPARVPCAKHSDGRYHCGFYPAGDGIRGGAVVVNDSGYWVVYLNQGDNWVSCQMYGGRVTHGSFYNHWWAWTEANDHKWWWVNAVWASGGANDGKFAGVPGCDPKPKPKPAHSTVAYSIPYSAAPVSTLINDPSKFFQSMDYGEYELVAVVHRLAARCAHTRNRDHRLLARRRRCQPGRADDGGV